MLMTFIFKTIGSFFECKTQKKLYTNVSCFWHFNFDPVECDAFACQLLAFLFRLETEVWSMNDYWNRSQHHDLSNEFFPGKRVAKSLNQLSSFVFPVLLAWHLTILCSQKNCVTGSLMLLDHQWRVFHFPQINLKS